MNIIKNLMRNCKFCGEEFKSTRERKVYCSDECFESFQRERRRKYSRDNKEAIYKRRTTCKYCGNKFKMKELKERCCDDEQCIKEKEKEKKREAKRKYYNKNIKRTTKKFKKQDAENSRNYRRNHKEEINKRKKSYRKIRREWVDNIKREKECIKCKEERWFCLAFHHLDPEMKKFTIAECVSRSFSKKAILEEIDKCVVLCNNCHQHLHYLENNVEGWSPTKEWFNNKEINENNYF